MTSPWWLMRPYFIIKFYGNPAGGSYNWYTQILLQSDLRPNTGTEFKPVTKLWTPLSPIWWHTENLPQTTQVLPGALWMTEFTGADKQREPKSNVGVPWDFANLSWAQCWWNLALVKILVAPMHTKALKKQQWTGLLCFPGPVICSIWHWPLP